MILINYKTTRKDSCGSGGHVTYSPVFFKKPPGVLGGVEWPVGSGIFYFKKSKHTIFNPNWSPQRIKEECSLAFANKKVKRFERIINQSNGQTNKFYLSTFSDGTIVEIKMSNFDNYLGQPYNDHLNLFKIIY